MANLLGSLKDMFLDLFSMGKGFAYGFIMVGLFIVICGAVIYGVFFIKNHIF